MVKVILKGTRNEITPGFESDSKRTYDIGEFNAGIVLREQGGIFLTITDMELSNKIEKIFKEE